MSRGKARSQKKLGVNAISLVPSLNTDQNPGVNGWLAEQSLCTAEDLTKSLRYDSGQAQT
jgi:hypothetical protein